MMKTRAPARSFVPPLYAMARLPDGSVREIGGPFDDIDDVLDTAWGHMMSHDVTVESVFFFETVDGRQVQREFPRGALPDTTAAHAA